METEISLIIAGASGAMGKALLTMSSNDARFALKGATDRADSPIIGINIHGAWVTSDLRELIGDVYIDFTIPEATLAALKVLRTSNAKAAIIGTTGFTPEQEEEIAEHAKHLTIVKTGNFSLGVNLLSGFVKKAAEILGEGWDIEIIEAHHKRKIDAPSGTALLLGDAAANGRNKKLSEVRVPAREGITGARVNGTIGFSAIRGGGIIGEHDVRFESESESIIFTHRAHDRSLFAKGALEAAAWAVHQPPGLYNMHDVLGL